MKRLLTLIFLGLVGFYAVWPIYSGWRLVNAMNKGDETGLANLVDFDSVRRSMRPVVESQVAQRVDQQMAQAGPLAGKLAGDMKSQLTGPLTDAVLAQVVTPANVIRIAREGGNVAGTVEKIMMEQMGKMGGALPNLGSTGSGGGVPGLPGGLGGVLGGLGGAAGQLGIPGLGGGAKTEEAAPAAPKSAATPTAAPSYGLGNIKGFGFAGPLGLSLSVARDPAAAKPDLTTVMRFTGFDWKITDVVPHM